MIKKLKLKVEFNGFVTQGLFTILIFFFFNSIPLLSQAIVISEYYNETDPLNEWTELIVVQDNIKLENYQLRDSKNSGIIPDLWAGSIQFTSNALWYNLRAGTIIVIKHRGNDAPDINKSDGFIMIGAENTNYFTKFTPSGIWNDNALIIEDDANVLELLDDRGDHVHSLSHMSSLNGVYLDINGPQLNYPGKCPVKESISVTPGRQISDYGGGSSNEWCIVSDVGNFVTQGSPNKRNNYLDDNLKYWQSLRQPKWGFPNLSFNYPLDHIELQWEPCDDNPPVNPSEDPQGYLIIRCAVEDTGKVVLPKNGTSYKAGDKLGSAIVIDNRPGTNQTDIVDNISFGCNESYTYYVFVYRYSSDDLKGNNLVPSLGRGRTYNTTNYAKATTIRKQKPVKPIIKITGNDNKFCAGTSLELVLTNKPSNPFEIYWYYNSQKISGANGSSYFANESGTYSVEVSKNGCSSQSDPVILIKLPTPNAELFNKSNKILKDSSLILCQGESFIMTAKGGDKYEWFRDNQKLSQSSTTFLADLSGLYYFAAINNGMACADTSVKIKIKILNISYQIAKDTLFYYLDKFTPYQDQQVSINNLSTDTLNFTDIMIPPGGIFSVFAPPPSETILPLQNKQYTIRFEPDRSGDFLDSIMFLTPCQNSFRKVYLVAQKVRLDVSAIPNFLNFDSLLACEKDTKQLIFKVVNNEDIPVELREPIINSPFRVFSPDFPITLNAKLSQDVTVEFYASAPKTYANKLTIPFIANGIKDQIIVNLTGTIVNTSFKIESYGIPVDTISFPELTGCEDSVLTSIQIFNTGAIDLEFSQVGELPGIYLENMPVFVNAGQSKEVRVYFIPESEGNFDEMLYLTTEPCGYLDSIRFLGSKNGITFALTQKKISFEKIIQCKNPLAVNDTFSILASGEGQELPYIEKITGPKNLFFKHDLKEGVTLKDNNKFNIQFEALPSGEYFDTIRVLIMPCEIEKVIPLYGHRIDPEFKFNLDTLNFGTVEIETSDTNFITIHNTGLVDIKIEEINKLLQPFKILTTLPLILEPDSSYNVYFEFAPLLIKPDTLRLKTIANEPCNITKDLILIGKGGEPNKMNVKLSIPLNLIGEPGQIVKIPVNIKSLDKRLLDKAEITSFDLSFSYNSTLIYPSSISAGNALNSSLTNKIDFKESLPGTINVHTEIGNPELFMDGTLFEISFLVLIGNNISTPLNFNDLSFQSKIEILPDTNNGFLTLFGECNLPNRLLNMDASFDLYLTSTNPVSGILDVIVNIPSSDETELSLIDNLGTKVKTIASGSLPPGLYNYSINSAELSDGIYFIQVRNGRWIKHIKIIILQ